MEIRNSGYCTQRYRWDKWDNVNVGYVGQELEIEKEVGIGYNVNIQDKRP